MTRSFSNSTKITAALILSFMVGNSCNNQKYNSDTFLESIHSVNDSLTYFSNQWNGAAGKVLKDQTEVAKLTEMRKAYSDYLQRAQKNVTNLTSGDKYSEALKQASLQFIQSHQMLADTFSLRIEALPSEQDSIAEKAYLLVYESQKLNAELEDAYLRLKSIEQVFLLKQKDNKPQQQAEATQK